MRILSAVAFALGLLVAILAARTAHAEPAVTLAEARDAIAIYEEGKRRQAAGEHEAAYLLYLEADAMYPGALPKFRAARCLEELGRAPEALALYRDFVSLVDEGDEPKHADLVAEAKARIAALEPKPAAHKSAKKKQAPPTPRVPAPPLPADDGLALRVSGFVLLGLTLGSGAGLAGSFAHSRLANSSLERDRASMAVNVLGPVTAGLAIATAVVLPLGYRDAADRDEPAQARVELAPLATPTEAGLSATARF
jgi:tetratricopeptide (TPR) repeat protein